MRRTITLSLIALVAIGAWYGYRLIWGKPLSIHHFADRVALQELYRQPELLTYLGLIENTPIDFHSNRLSDLSPPSLDRWRQDLQANHQQLQAYREDNLDRQEQLTLAFMEWSLGSEVAASAFPYHFINGGPYPVNQISGEHMSPLQLLDELQQVVDLKSSRRYLERMAAIPAYIDSLIAAVAYRDELGANPPRVLIKRSLEQLAALTATPPDRWSIHERLLQTASELQLGADARTELSARSVALLETAIVPAYARLADTLAGIMDRAPEEVGVWTLPEGEAYYRALLYAQATTRKTPDEIHALGLELVGSFREELVAALDSLGYREGGIAERIDRLMDEPGARYDDTEAGRQAIIADFARIGEELAAGTAPVFGMRPSSPVEVVRVPAYAENGEALARYSPPALDGSRPGRFMINLRAPGEIERHGMRTLSAHESIPGHHFQVAITQTLSELPMVRRNDYIPSYGEGWALYVEELVHELGLHDTRSNIGRLQSMLFRASRLVVDTGIHARRWTRDRAIDYMRENTGMPLGDVTNEIDRYIAMPGQACSYMLGMQAILAAREAARERQGAAFRLPAFHDAVLENGPLPIEVLEDQLVLVLQ